MKKYFQKKVQTVKRAFGIGDLTENAQYISSMAQALWKDQGDAQTGEAYSVDSLKLSKEQLEAARNAWSRLLKIFAVLAFLSFCYVFYNLLEGYYSSALISTALTVVLLAQCFRYHFWLFQLKQGKLGCTWREWLNALLKKQEKGQ